MKQLIAIMFLAGGLLAHAQANKEITVVISPKASEVEKLAARELSEHLQILYHSVRFPVRDRKANRGPAVLMGTIASLPELARYTSLEKLSTPESFVVTTAVQHGSTVGVVVGADPRGLLYAVYALLEKLGFGFYLSFNTKPPVQRGPFTFAGWRLADRPLTPERFVFDWHNFLSGCSAWSLGDWEKWVQQAARMRFNAIMVHAYGNNPMFSFVHNGKRKPTGYLATTARGRDWGTEHVLDVRRIIGGARLFASPVFGSPAALVPKDQTVRAATGLMQKVFRLAAARGMGVTFALDVDTESSNPQNIISTLPATARFSVKGFQFANPDTADGYAYYRSQVRQLLETYPQITQVAVWFRGGFNSPWRGLKLDDFPTVWRSQYDRAIQAHPELYDDPEAPSLFAISKIVAAFRRALDETGHATTSLAVGTWRFGFLRAANAFMPAGVKLIALDYSIAFATAPVQEAIRAVSGHRPVLPVVWAQHDDHSYAGRPYTPFAGFASLLRASGSTGFGIIHWTTRPLDLYFSNLAAQVWAGTENQSLETTCERMAERTFGVAARDVGKEYLFTWIRNAPMFGRETTDRFIDRHLEEEPAVSGCLERLKILDRLRPLTRTSQAIAWVDYFQDWERFVIEFFRAHAAWQRSVEAWKKGDITAARRELTDCKPEVALEQYARTIAHGGATSGEKGILISLNLRWLPYIVSQRQALGLDGVRVRFAPTSHESLAQAPGMYTFAFDTQKHLWQVLGQKEIGAPVTVGASAEPCLGGLQVSRPVPLRIETIAGQTLPSVNYRLRMEVAAGDTVEVSDGVTLRFEAASSPKLVTVTDGRLDLTFRPASGPASVCGLVLHMIGRDQKTP